MNFVLKIKLFLRKKESLKIIGTALLFIGAAIAFYIGFNVNKKDSQEALISPFSPITSSPEPSPTPEYTIPPQPTFKPQPKKSPTPTPESITSPSPGSTESPSPTPTETPAPTPTSSPTPSPTSTSTGPSEGQ